MWAAQIEVEQANWPSVSQLSSRGRSAYQERAVLRASVTTADTVADRAATSIDTVPWLELDVAWLAGSATLSEMAIDVAVEDRITVLRADTHLEERLTDVASEGESMKLASQKYFP